jgi:hypothetical protein
MFIWLESPRSKRAQKSAKAAREAMVRQELEERASLLFRLGYSKKRTRARLRENVAWDFELSEAPKSAAEIDAIVDAVYRRG